LIKQKPLFFSPGNQKNLFWAAQSQTLEDTWHLPQIFSEYFHFTHTIDICCFN
jgi:hypothetical protein